MEETESGGSCLAKDKGENTGLIGEMNGRERGQEGSSYCVGTGSSGRWEMPAFLPLPNLGVLEEDLVAMEMVSHFHLLVTSYSVVWLNPRAPRVTLLEIWEVLLGDLGVPDLLAMSIILDKGVCGGGGGGWRLGRESHPSGSITGAAGLQFSPFVGCREQASLKCAYEGLSSGNMYS